MKKDIKDIIKQTIDFHFHIGPEIIPRSFNNVKDLIENQSGKIQGLVLKNHFYPTTPLINEVVNKKGLMLIGSITLNNFTGGINSESIYSASILSDLPIVVWFPTVNAQNFLNKSASEIPWEWVKKKSFKARKSSNIKGIEVLDKKGNLSKETQEVLKVIKETQSILATGHLSWQESKELVKEGLKFGIKNIIITHPIYQKIDMPVNEQIKLAKKGCMIEICYSMFSMDKIPIIQIVQQIEKIGYKNIILSSDVGQPFSPLPDQALIKFANLLLAEGITLDESYRMMVSNPKNLIKK